MNNITPASTELVVKENLVPSEIFKPDGIDAVLAEIAARARAFSPTADVSTAKGRKEISSAAYKVAQSKTLLDGMGKELAADWKAKSAAVDVERRKLREFLDSLKEEVRAPLTAWEQAEEARVAAIKDRIGTISGLVVAQYTPITCNDVGWLKDRINQVMKITIDDSFAEFKAEAALAKDEAIGSVSTALGEAEEAARREAEQREIEKKEAAERERLEEERKAAEERQRLADEAAAQQADRDRIAREKAEEEARQKREAEAAEQRRIQWEAEAKQREEAAAKAAEERLRAQAERQAAIEAQEAARAQAEDARRISDQEHRRKVNNDALQAIAALGVTDDQARTIVLAIVNGEIPRVAIKY